MALSRRDAILPVAMAFSITRLSPTEARSLASALVALAVRSKASWGYDQPFMAAFERSMDETTTRSVEAAGSDVTILVAYDEGDLVGFAVVADERRRAWLEDLWVEPARFRRGIGRALWEAAVDDARRISATTLELEADPSAVPFYERMGARIVGQRPSTLADGRMLPIMRFEVG